MTSTSFPSAVRYIPVSWSASAAVFRLEVQVLGRGNAPSKRQDYELEHLRNGEKWLLKVKHYRDEDYSLSLLPPQAARSVSYRRYQRTDDGDVRYTEPNTQLIGALDVATFYIGVEVSVAGEQPTNASRSPWTFTSSEQMPNWDVILSVGETNFYAHRAALSLVSSTFHKTFNGDFREHNQQEVPVNVEGTDAEHFDAFLHCVYPFGVEPKAEHIVPLIRLANYYDVKPLLEKCVDVLGGLPDVFKLDKLRIALEVNATELEERVLASLTKDDIQELLVSDLKDVLGAARWQKIAAMLLAL